MTDTLHDLDALAERYPQHANLIRTIKSEILTAERAPMSEATRAVLAANIVRLADAIAADGRRK